ncbi:hypothetical protein [Pseudomonas huanghezhanensis]|uniref:hypothetical protein n=1 Tax=Pseudomonas huanghezhanensis TaxID=3002903 RepID=UPI00228677B1|nr:hypothetical protein [Pseudomonas sp. BSw22131]
MPPVMGAVLLCAIHVSALAADTTSTANASTSDQHVREQIEAKRDQLSGADKIGPSKQQGANSLLDAPVETDDAPTQVQRP